LARATDINVLVSDAQPLRLNEIFARTGGDSTLADWCDRALQGLQPLIERIEADSSHHEIESVRCMRFKFQL
jgi:hypothetical protein